MLSLRATRGTEWYASFKTVQQWSSILVSLVGHVMRCLYLGSSRVRLASLRMIMKESA